MASGSAMLLLLLLLMVLGMVTTSELAAKDETAPVEMDRDVPDVSEDEEVSANSTM